MSLEWIDAGAAVLNGVKVRYATTDHNKQRTTSEEIVVLKPKAFFDDYMKLIPDPNARLNIVELGIFEGGSALILAEMFPNAKIEAFDLRPPNPEVLSHLKNMNLSDRVRLHYGISQTNEEYIKDIVNKHLGGHVDIVIDDASHHYDFTKTAFEILFQFLPENGTYIIEDWGWAHWMGTAFDDWKGVAMSSFILELVMCSASNPGLIRSVLSNSRYAIVKKGNAVVKTRLNIENIIKIKPRQWSKVQI